MLPGEIATYTWPGQLQVGFGAAGRIGPTARALSERHVYVMTDTGVISAGLLEPVLASLRSVGLSHVLYDRIKADPDIDSVEEAAASFRKNQTDVIIGFGGGSVIDTAKAVRLLAGGEGRLTEYDLLLGSGVRLPPRRMPNLIAIPTTAGTGSDVTSWAMIVDPVRKLKFAVGGAFLIPNASLIDPELMVTLPPLLTAATGIDALSHCIESYVSITDCPVLDPMILYGIELIGKNLRVAVAQGTNRAARKDMALAAMIGGLALNSKWCGACHSLAHQLSTFGHVHHGVAIALILPHQMRYSLIGAIEKYAQIGQALGIETGGSVRQQAERAVEAVQELVADLGLPASLRSVGITEEMLPAMAKNAYIDDSWAANPRTVSEAVMEQLFRAAL